MTTRLRSKTTETPVVSSSSSVVCKSNVWDLPDVLFFRVLSFVAAPTHRASIVCHTIAPLCQSARRATLEQRTQLWDEILRHDYGVVVAAATTSDPSTGSRTAGRRACKRLKRTPLEKVRDAHLLVCQNTEIAYFYLTELVNGTGGARLSRAGMVSLLHEYGPHLRMNRRVSSGGLFLVEVTRAKHVKETVVLRCVQELVQHWGVSTSMLDLATNESALSTMTALCVSAVRGMHSVVRYLLRQGADRNGRSSGRFAMHTTPKKSLRLVDATAQEFAMAMMEKEKSAGASKSDLMGLEKCIRLLK